MRIKLMIAQVGLVLFLMATAVFAQPAASSAPACGQFVDAPFMAPLSPAPEVRVVWPAPGNAQYDASLTPSCIWTCRTGARSSKQVASEEACQTACAQYCHTGCLMV
jgi:hypothetical protein